MSKVKILFNNEYSQLTKFCTNNLKFIYFLIISSSVAQEASEVDGKMTKGTTANGTSKNGGLFQRTISKIWRIPEGITGVAYSGIETPATPAAKKPEAPAADSSASKNGSCVIS